MMGDAPSLARLPASSRRELVARFELLLGLRPMISFSKSLFGGRLWMLGITLPASPALLEHLHRTGERALVRSRVQEALELARARGCTVAALGAHTSILTANGTAVRPPDGMRVCTGNTLTVAVALEQLRATEGRIGIVGAAGNIGAALAELLADRELLLAGRVGTELRLEGLRDRLGTGTITTDLDDLRSCGTIVVATSGSEPVLHARHVDSMHEVRILDIAQPSGCSPRLASERPMARVLGAALVRLPQDPDFVMSTHTPPGAVFACAGEAMLLGLEGGEMELTGAVRPAHARTLGETAKRWGLI